MYPELIEQWCKVIVYMRPHANPRKVRGKAAKNRAARTHSMMCGFEYAVRDSADYLIATGQAEQFLRSGKLNEPFSMRLA